MKKLQLNMLINTCQNQWKGLISKNENFKVKLYGPNGYILDLNCDYTNSDDYYVYREIEVSNWEIIDQNTIRVELTW